MKYLISLFIISSLFGEYYYNNGKKVELIPDSISRSGIKYYKLPNGEKIGVNNYILVKFNKAVDIDYYLRDYNLTLIKTFHNNLYLFKTPINEALDISDKLYLLKDVKFAHPDFIHQIHRR